MEFPKSQFKIGSVYDPLIVSFLEGGLILAVGFLGWITRQPLVFTSLGPTAYELVEMPRRRSAQPYSIIVGHLAGVGAGFLAMALIGAWPAPAVATSHSMPLARVFAAALSVAITVAVNLALKSSQPAACSTALMISLGSRQTGHDAWVIIVGVLLITAIGAPLRRLRMRRRDVSVA